MSRWVSLWDALPALRAVNVDAARVVQPGDTSETRQREALLDVQTSARNAAVRAAHAKGVALEDLCCQFRITPPAALAILAATAPSAPIADEQRRYRELILSDDPAGRHRFRVRVMTTVREKLRCTLSKGEERVAHFVISTVFHLLDGDED